MGILRRNLHCHRRRPHSLCPARSYSLELASHCPSRHFPGDCRRLSILSDYRSSHHPGFHALRRAHSPWCRPHDLGMFSPRGFGTAVCYLLLSSSRFFRKPASRLILGSDLSQFYRACRLPPRRIPSSPRLPRPRDPVTSRNRDLLRLAAQPLLRQYRSFASRCSFYRTWHGTSGPRRRRISSGIRPLHPDLRLRHSRRPHGNSIPCPRDGLCLGIAGGLRCMESSGPSARSPRITAPQFSTFLRASLCVSRRSNFVSCPHLGVRHDLPAG